MLLELDQVNAYYDKSHVLQNVSLQVDKGEVVALLGRNGSGRSTTCKTIMGLVNARTGTIRFKGKDITNKSPFSLAQAGIAFVPEDRRIFPNLTVGENLRLAALAGRKGEWTEKRIYDVFEVLGERKDKPAKLSGGEQQMLAIARVMMAGARLILMDEPTQGLAPAFIRHIRDMVFELKRLGVTVLLVEQNARVALSVCDRGYIMEKGSIVFEASSQELRESPVTREKLGV